jgi:hypothetical protein
MLGQFSDILNNAIATNLVFTPDPARVNLIITIEGSSWVPPTLAGGNPVSQAATELRCYAKRLKKIEEMPPNDWFSPEMQAIKGRCVAPLIPPARFRPGSIHKATLYGKDGFFYCLICVLNPFGTQNQVGARIAGYWSSQEFQRV